MTDREKLLKLILEADDICEATDCVYGDNCKYSKCTWCRHEMTADHLLAHGVTIQRWIPVEERLPEKEEYTAMAEDGTEYYTRLLIAYKTDIVEYEIGYYDGYKWMTEMPIRLIKDVVAWMPFHKMPEPPKEVE